MGSLIDETPQADVWLDSMRKALSPKSPYGRIVDAVLWTSTLTDQGVPLVEVEPNELVEEINSKGIPLLLNHDPGAPRGMVLLQVSSQALPGLHLLLACSVCMSRQTASPLKLSALTSYHQLGHQAF